MNLYFQILTHAQTLDALELMNFVSVYARDGTVAGNTVMSTGGKTATFKFASVEELLVKLRNRKFNQFEIQCEPKNFELRLDNSVVKSFNAVFTPSSSSEIWFDSADWQVGGDRLVRTRKMNAKVSEKVREVPGIKRPNIIEAVFELKTKTPIDLVLEAVAEQLFLKAPDALIKIQPFGCCDIGGKDFLVKMEVGVTMTEGIRIMAGLWHPTYPMLGKRFDKLHMMMFGNAKLCGKIASNLGEDAKLFAKRNQENWAVLYLKSGRNIADASIQVEECLLQKENARCQAEFELTGKLTNHS